MYVAGAARRRFNGLAAPQERVGIKRSIQAGHQVEKGPLLRGTTDGIGLEHLRHRNKRRKLTQREAQVVSARPQVAAQGYDGAFDRRHAPW